MYNRIPGIENAEVEIVIDQGLTATEFEESSKQRTLFCQSVQSIPLPSPGPPTTDCYILRVDVAPDLLVVFTTRFFGKLVTVRALTVSRGRFGGFRHDVHVFIKFVEMFALLSELLLQL